MAKSVSASETAGAAMTYDQELLVRCIAIRAAYGGMAGDVTMLREFAAVWSTRLASTPINPSHPQTAGVNLVEALLVYLQSCGDAAWLAYMVCSHACQGSFLCKHSDGLQKKPRNAAIDCRSAVASGCVV